VIKEKKQDFLWLLDSFGEEGFFPYQLESIYRCS
jgi:hypothetical protein